MLIYRKYKGWQCPYIFLYRNGRLSFVLDDKSIEHLLHNTMLKTYKRPYLSIRDMLNPTDAQNPDISATVYSFLVQTVHDEFDPRFKDARQKEYDGIKQKGDVIPFPRSKLPPNPNIVRNRYVLCIKYPVTNTVRLKARWILMGHYDKLRKEISNNSPMLMRMSFRIIISFSVSYFNLLICTQDVEKAYIQSTALMCDIFTEAPREVHLPETHSLKMILPHYGLVESSSCFFDNCYPVFVDLLDMKPGAFDQCF